MLFYITDSLIVEKRDNRYPKIRKAIRNLLIGYSESKLMLLADYSVLEWMLNQFEYDEDLISPLKYLYVNYATMGIPEELKFYWEIRSDIASESKRENGDVVIFSISYLMIQDSVSIQKCALIGEDENDCCFYRYILDWYQQYNGHKINCDFQNEHGGGGRMEVKVADYSHKYKPAFALVDTDDKYEGQIHAEQTTRQKCERASRNHKCTFWLEILPVHEIENLIPLNYVDKLNWNEANAYKKRAFDYLRNNAHSEMIFKYFDLKKGIHFRDIQNDSRFKEFAGKCFYKNPELYKIQSFDEYIAGMNNDDDVVYPALRENLFSQVLKNMKGNKSYMRDSPPELLEFQNDAWLCIGRKMLSWGCVRNSEAINI